MFAAKLTLDALGDIQQTSWRKRGLKGNDHIEENDHVVIISVEPGISDLNEVLYK